MATLFIILIFMSYITLGLPDSAYGTAWPYMRAELGMPLAAAGIFSIIVMICSALSAAIMPKISKKVGTGTLLAVCSLVTGASILGISFCHNYYIILALAVPLGIAGGGVDVSINNYVSERYSSRIMNWVHASWGLGAMIGPLLITLALNTVGTWRVGFQILAGIQLAFSVILFIAIPFWKKNPTKINLPSEEVYGTQTTKKRRNLAAVFAILSFLIYGGVETAMGNWLNSLLVEGRALDTTISGTCVSVFYGAIMLGRLFFGIFSNKLGNRRAIYIGLSLALIGSGIFFIKNVTSTYFAVGLIGLGFAPIYPCLMHETTRRFAPDFAKKVVGFQVSFACIGMIAISPLIGLLMQKVSLEVLTVAVTLLISVEFVAVIILNLLTPTKNVLATQTATDNGTSVRADANAETEIQIKTMTSVDTETETVTETSAETETETDTSAETETTNNKI